MIKPPSLEIVRESRVSFESVEQEFRAAARIHATLVAVACGAHAITYGQLDRLTDNVARNLVARGVPAGGMVGVEAVRSPETIIALIGILKAGACYVPLPGYYPTDQLRGIAEAAQMDWVIGSNSALQGTSVVPLAVRDLVKPAPRLPKELRRNDPETTAYVMFTSGSTGEPKGVLVPHRAIIRLVLGQNFMSLGPGERILQNAPIAFDAATLEIWGALLNGGTLVIPEDEHLTLRGLGDVIRDQRISSIWLTAGLFHAMADERPADFAPLRQLLTGGDIVSPARVAKVMAACPQLVIVNGYGPTENTTFTCCHTVTRAEAASGLPLPIGRPIIGTEVYIVDEGLSLVPEGEPGELCAAGSGLASGYLGRPDLTAEKFVPASWNPDITLYRTGDAARRDESGLIHYLGRIDKQVKIRGFRLEMGEVEAALESFGGIVQAAVIAKSGADSADKTLVAFYVASATVDPAALQNHLRARLPDYAVPAQCVALDALPLTANGKLDRGALAAFPLQGWRGSRPLGVASKTAALLADALAEGLETTEIDRDVSFFDLGASSLHLARLHARLETAFGRRIPITDLFRFPTISTLAAHLDRGAGQKQRATAHIDNKRPASASDGFVAIIGMAGRFPGAPTVHAFWDGLLEGREMISHFSAEDLEFDPAANDPGSVYVCKRGVVAEADLFDARHFGISPREAERMDPQHRILLELAQTALEDAGHDADRFDGRIGLFAGVSQNSYLLNNLVSGPGAARAFAAGYPVRDFATLFGNDKDFLTTRVAYKLNLTGPAMTVQCACSTSLVAVAQACDSLRSGASDMALAGGVSVTFPQKRPYLYTPDGMASSDGHCRAFDAAATGTVFGDGAGVVVLRRLDDAMAAGDDIVAVIRGHAINNDGSEKAGYAAPSIGAQTAVIRAAQAAAGVDARSIGYVEAHGTGTPLGDPIEFAALSEAFSASTGDTGFCGIGTAKTNVGHLDIAAGVTGLIKAAMTLKEGVIPPLLHYAAPNPNIDFAESAFFPVTERTPWPRGAAPRRAGVSAFGVGGTNIHMILEEPPLREQEAVARAIDGPVVFPVSASSEAALADAVRGLGAWAGAHSDADPAEVAATLRDGRRAYPKRTVLVAAGMSGLAEAAQVHTRKPVDAARPRKVAFLFPGQGAQHVGMGRGLFEAEPVFREALTQCAWLLEPELGLDLLGVIHAPESQRAAMAGRLKDTALAQPAIFATGYALARQWAHWGIAPDVMIGHSIGEFAAACLSGVFDLTDALRLIALRGKLMAGLPGGVMLAVRGFEEDLKPFIGQGLDLAAVNGPNAAVLAGPAGAADEIEPKLNAAGFATSRLHTSHAFHSHMMDPAVQTFRDAVAAVELRAPRTAILSTVTGDWLTATEATDPDYWASHMRRPVRFLDAMQRLWQQDEHIVIETGPGRTLSTLAAQNPDPKASWPALASLPHAMAEDQDAHRSMLEAFGLLWANGNDVDWERLAPQVGTAPRRRAKLPTYPFQRKRFWVEPVPSVLAHPLDDADAAAESSTGTETPAQSVANALREMFHDLSGIAPDEMVGAASFLELGFDSLLLTQVTKEISDRFGVTVTLRQLINGFGSIDALAALVGEKGDLRATPPADRTPMAEMTSIERGHLEEGIEGASGPMTAIDIAHREDALSPVQRAHVEGLIASYVAKTKTSKAKTAEFRRSHADPRTASGFNRMWKEIVYQIVTVKSKGSRLIDIDGNEYIDLLNGFGPGFLGYGYPPLVAVLQSQIETGFEVGPQSLVAMEAAELFCEVTGNERTSFVNTGSEAVYAAIRLARTVTGRDRIVMFARDYHGNFDEVLVRSVAGRDGPRSVPLAPGIPRDSVRNVVVLSYGSPEALDYIRRHAGEIAAVVIEPVQSRRPEFRPTDFIREVRRITEAVGSLLVFDEVVTGFRFGPRGAQGLYGVEADIVTYGKIVGGGLPVGVVAGRARFMDTFDGGQWAYGDDSFPQAPVTFFAGTFVRHPLAMVATKTMLEFFKAQPDFFWKTVNAKGDRLAGNVDRWFEDHDMPFRMPNCGSLMYLRVGEDQAWGNLLFAHLRHRGVFVLDGFPSYVTAAHTDEDIDYAIEAIKDSALDLRAGGMLVGREAVAYPGPRVFAPPARLSLPGGDATIAEAMMVPLGRLSVPTTEAQREIWAAVRVTPELSPAYNESVTLKLDGAVDIGALRKATRLGILRHDALRSTFSADGTLMRVAPDMDFAVPFVDLAEVDATRQVDRFAALLHDEVDIPFDLERGPLVRCHLVALGPRRHHLVITAHHIVCDGWSIDVVMRDIAAIYAGLIETRPPLLPRAQSIIDYARVEHDWQRSLAARQAEAYWLSRFEGALPVLDLPTDRPRSALRSVRGARLDHSISADVSARLRRLARSQGSTFVALFLAAYKLYIARIAGTTDVVIGVPFSGQAARGMDTVVGHCVNLLPIRTRIDWAGRFDSYLKQVQDALLAASEHQSFTYGSLIRTLKVARDPSRIALVPVIFNTDTGIDISQMAFGDTTCSFVTNPRNHENFEIYLNVTEAPDTVRCEWSYNADLFDRATIERHVKRFGLLLEGLTETPDILLAEIGRFFTTAAPIPAGGITDDPGATGPQTILEVFAKAAEQHADRTALRFGARTMDYATLDARSDALAALLAERGIAPGDLVGISSRRCLELPVAVLGVLKTGAGYVPFDASLPDERLAFMAKDTAVKVLLGDCPQVARTGVETIPFDAFPTACATGSQVPRPDIDGNAIAYVMYTSGTTGWPKGVVLPHRSVIRLLVDTDWIELGPETRTLHSSAFAFDTSIIDIFGALLHGGELVIPPDGALSLGTLGRQIVEHRVNTLWLTSGLFCAMADERPGVFSGVRQVIVGGDVVSPTHVERVMMACPGVIIINGYGPTESNVATAHAITAADLASGTALPIGRAIAGTQAYILDDTLQPVEPGLAGELCIAGRGLALGYWNRPELTAEKFVKAPWDPTKTIYRTGDLACDPGNGVLRFFGRIDTQVKIRGFRVELGEVEAALESHADVQLAVVVARVPPGRSDKVLVAYFVPKDGRSPDRSSLLVHLKRILPDFAVPSHFQPLDQIPLNQNGKVDRRALPSVDPVASAGAAAAATQTERELTDIWQRLLGLDDVGVDANFFELGGHSLLAVRLFDRIQDKHNLDLPISTLFKNSTIRELAAVIDASRADSTNRPLVLSANEDWDTTTLINPGPSGSREAPLFIVGGAGGNVNNLYDLGTLLGMHRPVVGFQSRGVLGHTLRETVEEAAAEHIRYMRAHQPEGPYHLAGYSAGGLVAFEMARQLRAVGDEIGFLGMLDVSAPGFSVNGPLDVGTRLKHEIDLFRRFGFATFAERLRSALRKNIQSEGFLRRFGWLFPAHARYRLIHIAGQLAFGHYRGGLYGGDITLFLSVPRSVAHLRELEKDPLIGWPQFITGKLRVVQLLGDHLSILQGADAAKLVEEIEADIRESRRQESNP